MKKQCPCGKEFNARTNKKYCSKECRRKFLDIPYQQKWRRENPEKQKGYTATYKEKNPERFRELHQKSDAKRELTERRQEWKRSWRKEWVQNIKFSVMAVYCEGQPKCQCCGETAIEFLTIDHIHGHGQQHYREIKREHLTYWLKKNGFPEGYRVLCWNCNCALGHFGYCPHSFNQLINERVTVSE